MSTDKNSELAENRDSPFLKVVDYFLKTPKKRADSGSDECDSTVEKIRKPAKRPSKRQPKLDRRTTK